MHQLKQLDLLSESEPSWRGAEILWSVAWRPTRLMVLVEKIELKLSACSAIDKFPTSWRCEKRGDGSVIGCTGCLNDHCAKDVFMNWIWTNQHKWHTQFSPASSLRQVSFIYYMTDPEEEIVEFSADCCHCCCVSLPHSGPAKLAAEIWIGQILAGYAIIDDPIKLMAFFLDKNI